jgi:hypothetical protein
MESTLSFVSKTLSDEGKDCGIAKHPILEISEHILSIRCSIASNLLNTFCHFKKCNFQETFKIEQETSFFWQYSYLSQKCHILCWHCGIQLQEL